MQAGTPYFFADVFHLATENLTLILKRFAEIE
jgi:hypothetical protein